MTNSVVDLACRSFEVNCLLVFKKDLSRRRMRDSFLVPCVVCSAM